MEIERKYLIHTIPFDLSSFPFRTIEQGYLCTNPVVRIRKDNDRYELTYKSRGMMIREEHNLHRKNSLYDSALRLAYHRTGYFFRQALRTPNCRS